MTKCNTIVQGMGFMRNFQFAYVPMLPLQLKRRCILYSTGIGLSPQCTMLTGADSRPPANCATILANSTEWVRQRGARFDKAYPEGL